MKNYVAIANRYSKAVITGKIPACKWVKLACQRQVDDLARAKTKNFPYRFDNKKAVDVCKFIELLPHTKGKWARTGEKISLEPWQIFRFTTIFGWVKKKSGLRRFREAYNEVPRKNGKSIEAAAVGLYMFCKDGEYSPEVYSGATNEKQAFEVFKPAKLMVTRTPDLKEAFEIEVNVKNMVTLADAGKFEPVIGKPGDGSSPSCALIDEYHEHDTDDLYETMHTGMDAREQPLLFTITTAGTNMSGPCYEKRNYGCKVLEGHIKDETLFCIIYTIDKDDDWTDPATLKKANPNYGVSIIEDNILASHHSAIQNARVQNTFKTKRLNVWCGARSAWLNIQEWAQGPERKTLEELAGRRCFASLDLASKLDVAAKGLLFPPDGDDLLWHFHCKFYLPEDRVEDGNSNSAHYSAWAKQGFITLTPGNITDFEYIIDDLREDSGRFQIAEVPYDPFQATYLATQLTGEGFPMVEVGQTVRNFSEPMKHIEGLVKQKLLAHGGCPVLSWMASNVTAKMDKKENIFPNKDHDDNKIDGMVALIMGVNRALFNEDGDGSFWEQ